MAGNLITEDWEVEYDGVLFSTLSGVEIETIGLFTSPTIRTNDTPRPQAHGNYLGDDYYGARTFTMQVEVWGFSAEDLQQRLDTVLKATTIKAQPLPLVVRIAGREPLLMFARPMNRTNVLDIETTVGNVARFAVQWRADDPRIYSATENEIVLTLEAAPVGGQFDAQFDYTFGGSSLQGSAVLTNTGSIDSFPVVTIEGPVTNASLRAVLPTGQSITLSVGGTVETGEQLVIDMAKRTITIDGVSAYTRLLDPQAWFGLVPGTTNITFTGTTIQNATPTATIAWRSASV